MGDGRTKSLSGRARWVEMETDLRMFLAPAIALLMGVEIVEDDVKFAVWEGGNTSKLPRDNLGVFVCCADNTQATMDIPTALNYSMIIIKGMGLHLWRYASQALVNLAAPGVRLNCFGPWNLVCASLTDGNSTMDTPS